MSELTRRSRPRAPRPSQVGLPQTELVEEGGNLLDLLAGRREHIACPRSSQPEQHGRELDQLAGRPEDDEDHVRCRSRAVSGRAASARHIPAPCAAA